MKVGDLIKFMGSWGQTIVPGERATGVIVRVWKCGRTNTTTSADIFWDNGDCTAVMSSLLQVINASR